MKLNPGVAREFGVEGGMHIGELPMDEKTGKPVGPAREAGLQVDDIITHVNGAPVSTVETFRRAAEAAMADAKPSGDNMYKIELARRIAVRAFTLALAGTPERVPALPASPFSSPLGVAAHA